MKFLQRLILGLMLSIWMTPAMSDDIKKGESMTIWIDVRTAEEFSQGHVKGALLIPYEMIGAKIADVTADKTADIRLYCRSGRRSGVALDTLKALGYVKAVNEGGYEDLVKRKAAGEAIP